jgi:ribosomal protein L6P/L9E
VACKLTTTTFNVSDSVRYSESKNILVYGFLGISKFRYAADMIIYISNAALRVTKDSFAMCEVSDKVFISTISRRFRGMCFGYYIKYRIKGLGHRIYIRRNNFVYKIGYSHTVYKLLDLNLLTSPKRFKKEYYLAMRGLSITNVTDALNVIQSYRIPNCYCFNGIFIHGVSLDAKEGKKGFFL